MKWVGESVSSAHARINNEEKLRKEEIEKIHVKLQEQATENATTVTLIKTQSGQMKDVGEKMRNVNVKLDELESKQLSALQPMNELKDQVHELLGNVKFPVKKTVVAQRVWYEENEDLFQVASTIINKALELDDVTVVNVERKSGWESGSGLLKIELKSTDEVKRVLKIKNKLKTVPAKEMRAVYLRQSKKEEVLLMERNQDFILRELGKRDGVVRLPSRHLVRRTNFQSGQGGRGRGGRGRGRGRGSARDRTQEEPRPESTAQGGKNGPRERPTGAMNDIPISDYMA